MKEKIINRLIEELTNYNIMLLSGEDYKVLYYQRTRIDAIRTIITDCGIEFAMSIYPGEIVKIIRLEGILYEYDEMHRTFWKED